MIYAVYRCLFGEDFIQESIKSISNVVDKIFVFWDNKPWADVTECSYRGSTIVFPSKIDNILEKIHDLHNDKVIMIYDHVFNPRGQFTHLVNDLVLPNYTKPDQFLCIEVDHVFRIDQLDFALQEFKEKKYQFASTSQVELWRTVHFRIPDRPFRVGTVLWNMEKLNKFPPTGLQANIENMPHLSAYVHNLGFCVSKKVMFWRQMIALANMPVIKDTEHYENWFEEKWLQWDLETNNENLDMYRDYKKNIPYALPYNVADLPEIIKEKYDL